MTVGFRRPSIGVDINAIGVKLAGDMVRVGEENRRVKLDQARFDQYKAADHWYVVARKVSERCYIASTIEPVSMRDQTGRTVSFGALAARGKSPQDAVRELHIALARKMGARKIMPSFDDAMRRACEATFALVETVDERGMVIHGE